MKILLLLLFASSVCCYSQQNTRGQPNNGPQQQSDRRRYHSQSNDIRGFREVFAWKQIDYEFPNAQARQQALSSKNYDPSAVIPIGVTAAGSRLFVSTPRMKAGIPVSLSTVDLSANTKSPLLRPYPNWSWHQSAGNCEGITSVFRMKADECGRLWVLDTGVVNNFVQSQRLCLPQVLVFDLSNDRLIYRYRFPNSVLRQDSLLVTLEVEYPRNDCGGAAGAAGAVLYAADTTNFALIVADLRRSGADSAWRVQDKTMYPSPEAGTYTINGESFEFMDGILGLALSPRQQQSERKLFYHAMSSFRERWVYTRVLRNSTAAASNPNAFFSTQHTRPSQAAGCSMDEHGVMFYGLAVKNEIVCWNTYKPFNHQNLVTVMADDAALQFVSTTTVDPESRVWAVSTRLQKYILNSMSPREVNYRIFMAPSSVQLVQGTACEQRRNSPSSIQQSHGTHENQLVFPQ